jgi:chorismate mutase
MGSETQYGRWLDQITGGQPLVIAGPCSAETEEQVMNIAGQLKDSPVHIFRAGVWKPRTMPGSFEGVGESALKWLQEVKQETGLKVATEVVKPSHVELAIEHDIDVMWIGARSVVSPFTVQELAEAMRGTDKIVLIKNPVNPELGLWIGALERLMKYDIANLGVIHRGFSTYLGNTYRNPPNWQIPIDFKTRYPGIPMICDPSHICGKRDCIEKIAQTAYDLQYDGLMIETHNDPDSAWSDAAQQVTPARLKEILSRLIVRHKSFKGPEINEILDSMRSDIDSIDVKLIEVLNERMKIVEAIGKMKKDNNVAVFQHERFSEILDKMIFQAELSGLCKEFITGIYKEIHIESIKIQEKIFNS